MRGCCSVKVGIDARALGSQRGGDQVYTRNLIRELGRIDPGGDYTLFLAPPLPRTPIAGAARMRHVMVQSHLPFGRVPLPFALTLAAARLDVLHLHYIAPLFCPAPFVLTVHDLAYEHYPEFFPPGHAAWMQRLVPRAIKRAAAVLTVSTFSKRDIVAHYAVPPEKVVVAPLAADPLYRPLEDEGALAAVRARYGTGERFILCVGDLQPRKNLGALIAAYTRLRQADALRHKLVLVGKHAWLYDAIFAAARASGYAHDLVFTGYVPDEDLVALYNAAEVFVYPSLFEGFGLPPLEAMACGTPVIAANTASLPEVVGDGGVLVDPRDVEGLAAALARVVGDGALRTELAVRGRARAALFSWEATARTIHALYHAVGVGCYAQAEGVR